LLEVVLAVVMLGLVAASLTGAISAIEMMSARNKRMLAAYEVANRLVLTYLDDPQKLPSSTKPLEYGPYRFMWSVSVDGFSMKVNESQKRNTGATPQALDRFDVVTMTVFDSEEDGPRPRAGEELAAISRMYDIAAPRNPDQVKNLSVDGVMRIVQRVTGDRTSTGGSSGRLRRVGGSR
jgi:hypothetical protein